MVPFRMSVQQTAGERSFSLGGNQGFVSVRITVSNELPLVTCNDWLMQPAVSPLCEPPTTLRCVPRRGVARSGGKAGVPIEPESWICDAAAWTSVARSGFNVTTVTGVQFRVRRLPRPLCQRSCRLNRIGTFGGADSRKWLDTDKRTKIG
jgi:hypothetical protein